VIAALKTYVMLSRILGRVIFKNVVLRSFRVFGIICNLASKNHIDLHKYIQNKICFWQRIQKSNTS